MRRHMGAAALVLTAALLAGCGGSGSSTRDTARIRGVDAAVNAGTVNILVNNGSTNGSLNFLDVSDYLFIEPKDNIKFSYTTSVSAPANTSVKATQASLTKDQHYTAFLIGRADLPAKDTGDKDKDGKPIYANDPLFLQVVVAPARPTPPSGQASVRVLNAAPDAGAVDVRLTSSGGAPLQLSNVGFGAIPASQSVAPGAFQLSAAKTGASAALVSKPDISLQSGKSYTIILTEQLSGTPAAPVYGVKVIED